MSDSWKKTQLLLQAVVEPITTLEFSENQCFTEEIMDKINTTRRIHPLVAGAAVAVILASAVGVAAMTGVLPGAHGQNQPQDQTQTAPSQQGVIDSTGHIQYGTPPAAGNLPAETPPADAVNTAPPPPNAPAPLNQSATNQPVAQVNACHNCGVVAAVHTIEQHPQTSGVGAVAGALIGGVIGNRFGAGNGRALSTAAGAVGGGFAGNAIEKHARKVISYHVHVRMDDGTYRNFPESHIGVYAVGERVRIDSNGVLVQAG